MTIVDLFAFGKFNEVVVPLPDRHGILGEKSCREQLHWVCFASIHLCILPESIVASEGRNAASCTDTSTREESDFFASNYALSGLCGCHYLRLRLVLLRVFKTVTA